MTRTVLVSAGTYHLPFHRLVEWMQPWVLEHPEVRVVMQHGPGRPLAGAENHAMVRYDALLDLMRTADAIVLQGGAGGVMDARALGRIPILVPRVPVDDEVVDDHQLVFTQRVADLGLAHRATTAAELWRLIDGALAGTLQTTSGPATVTEGVVELARLLQSPPPRLPGRVRRRRLAGLVASVVLSKVGLSSTASAASMPPPAQPTHDGPGGVDAQA